VILAKPQTYMNLSGESVSALAAYFGVDRSRLIIIYDDIDIALGALRIRPQGSAGTHNGMKSVIQCLGSGDFPRVRIGIGAERGEQPLANYVLGGFQKSQVTSMEEAVDRAVDAIDLLIREGVEAAMREYNGS
jgi:PTH1 family peptidyl-tRNA hydrolase